MGTRGKAGERNQFQILGFEDGADIVNLETLTGAQHLDEEAEVSGYGRVLERLTEQAPGRRQAWTDCSRCTGALLMKVAVGDSDLRRTVGGEEVLGLHWVESGRRDADAPVLVLSNALGCTLEMWDPQLDFLNEHYRVVRYDQRGHGESVLPPGPYSLADLGGDVLGLLDRVGAQEFSVMGSSLGGMIGMWLASHVPERVQRLTVCCSSAWLNQREAELERATAAREHGTSELVSPTIERWFTPYFREHHGAETAKYAAMIASTDDEAYALCSETIANVDLRADLAAISAPTLVVAGADDPATPPEHGEAIVAGIGANSWLTVLPHVAHLANVERSEEFNALLEP